MMTQAFYSGISGIRSHQTAIDVSSNNIANISTIGYRGYNTEFASLFEKSLNTTSQAGPTTDSIGVGTRVNASTMDRSEGSLRLTERSTDLAIYGNGWFGVSNGVNDLYTRAGNFTFDQNNSLVTPDGMYLMGTMGNNIQGDILTEIVPEVELDAVGAQVPLQFPSTLSFPAQATTQASFFANLGLANEVRTVSAAVVDAQGIKNNLKLSFSQSEVQTPPGVQWDVVATVESLNGDEVYTTQEGTVSFGADGALTATSLTSIDNNGTPVAINLGEGFDGIRATNAEISTGYSVADGTIAGDLIGYDINRNAEVVATFTNGKQSSVGKVAIYHFQNEQGLDRVDSTKFRPSSNSGEALFYQDENGKTILGAEVLNFQLENSNVRLDTALTELIIYQRAFDASSKLITTADEMIQKAINMSK
ncbi:MAG: flagellar hook-basal body complex protein [Sulfurimonas sp.]|jgi:flagellar hook protein FlgE|nr:flagellar hook-basal body complex protein [Sulfurimonas sp.]